MTSLTPTRNARRAAAKAAVARSRARSRSARGTVPSRQPVGPNPLRLDPSRTGALRAKASAAVRARYDRLRTELYKAVVLEDALGLRAVSNYDPSQPRDQDGRWVNSKGFTPAMSEGVKSVNRNVTKLLEDRGVEIIPSDRPDVQARGGASFLKYQGVVAVHPAVGRPLIVTHEIGHAVDAALLSPKKIKERTFEEHGYWSEKALAKTLKSDKKAATPKTQGPSWEDRSRAWSYAWSSPQEAFAHVFAELHGSDERSNGFSVQDVMPKTFAAVKKKLDEHGLLRSMKQTRNADGANCGIGAGGFLPGNTCATGGSSRPALPTLLDTKRLTISVDVREDRVFYTATQKDSEVSWLNPVKKVSAEGTLDLNLKDKTVYGNRLDALISGKGYAREAMSAVLGELAKRGYTKMTTYVQYVDDRSQSMMGKLGATVTKEGPHGRYWELPLSKLTANAFFGTLTDRLTQFGRWLASTAATLWQDLEETLRGITQLAVRRGAGRAFDETRAGHFVDPNFRPAAREQFLHGALNRQENRDRTGALEKRITDEINNHRDSVVEKIDRAVHDGVMRDDPPATLWKEITTVIDRERDSAVTTVNDEVVRGHAEGQIVGYGEAGVTELFPLLEWTVHPDASKAGVCPRCRAMKGTVWTVADARGKIPLHRNCKCSWSARDPEAGPNKRHPSPAPTLYLPGAGAKFTGNVFCPTGEGGGIDPHCKPGGAGAAVTVEDLRPMLPTDADGRLGTKAIGAVTVTGYRVGKAEDPHGRGIFFAGDREGAEQYAGLHPGHAVQEHVIHLTNALLAGHQNDVTRLLFKKSYGEVYSGGVDAGRKADVKVAKELKKRGYDGVIYLKPAPPAKTEIGVFRKTLTGNVESGGLNCGVGPHGFTRGNTCARGGHPDGHGLSPEAEAYLATAWSNGGGGRKRPEGLPASRQAKLARSYASQILSAERSGKPGVALELAHAAPRVLPGAKLLSAAGAVEPHDGGRHEFAPGPPLSAAQLKGAVRVLRPGLTFPAPKNRRLLGGGGQESVVLRALVEPT